MSIRRTRGARVDAAARAATVRNHSGTHLSARRPARGARAPGDAEGLARGPRSAALRLHARLRRSRRAEIERIEDLANEWIESERVRRRRGEMSVPTPSRRARSRSSRRSTATTCASSPSAELSTELCGGTHAGDGRHRPAQDRERDGHRFRRAPDRGPDRPRSALAHIRATRSRRAPRGSAESAQDLVPDLEVVGSRREAARRAQGDAEDASSRSCAPSVATPSVTFTGRCRRRRSAASR